MTDFQSEAGFDALIVGGGVAGLYAALSLPPQLRVLLLTKYTLQQSASGWAQGGMAAAIDPQDSPALHAQDTLKAGAGLCEPAAVDFLVERAQEQVQNLLDMGIAFDRQGGQLALGLEAAHSRARVLHAADTTGRELVDTLTTQVSQRQNVTVVSRTLVLSLWLDSQTRACQGVCVLYEGQIHWWRSQIVILATGGGGQVFSQTTNPTLSTGDGVAIACRAGAQVRDLEFFQFHPTALKVPGAPRFLISEAVRGEGAHLIDRNGRRFLFDYHPAGELAPRDVISRAIYSHLQDPDQGDHVWLDLRPIPGDHLAQRFPKILHVCQHWGIDVRQHPIPVAPAAHYWMGGIVTNLQAETSIANLYAVGEVASTGVHGANRLASNSLLECLVFAAQLAHINLPSDPGLLEDYWQEVIDFIPYLKDWPEQVVVIQAIRKQLPDLVWRSAGICRDAAGLKAAIAQVKYWQAELLQLPLSQLLRNLQPGQSGKVPLEKADAQIRLWIETDNLLEIAELILRSAEFRTESRGGHYRRDYPVTDPDWQVHTLVEHQTWAKAALAH